MRAFDFRHLRLNSFTIFLSIASCTLLTCGSCLAQTRVSQIPVRVVVSSDGISSIEFRSIVPVSIDDAIEQAPDRVLVQEINADGSTHQGVDMKNDTGQAVRLSFSRLRPGSITLMPDGTWRLDQDIVQLNGWKLAPNQARHVEDSESIPLLVLTDPTTDRSSYIHGRFQTRSAGISVTYDPTNEPQSVSPQNIVKLINNTIAMYSELLASDVFSMTIDIFWSDQFGPGTNSATQSQSRVVSWTSARNNMQAFEFFFDEGDSAEDLLYDSLPPGSSVPFSSNSGSSFASQVGVPWPLWNKYTGLVAPTTQIALNNTISWDDQPSVGEPPIDAGSIDLQGTLVHEFGHALGFSSLVDRTSLVFPVIQTWDVFRFEPDATGFTTITANNMLSTNRQMRLGHSAVGATALNNEAAVYPMTDGLGANPGHWDDSFSSPYRIGIMRDSQMPGESTIEDGSYLQEADIRAFDVIGYAISPENSSLIIPPPGVVIPSGIPPLVNSASSTLLEWEAGIANQSFDVFITNAIGTIVFQSNDLTATSATLPADTLLPSRQYTCYIVSRNWRGFRRVSVPIFTLTSCDPDVNQDGNVDQNDVDYLIDVIAGGPNPAGADPDFNQDGNVDQNDVDGLINVVAGGDCP